MPTKQLELFTDNFRLTETGLEVIGEPDFEDWMDYGQSLAILGDTATPFAKGDWIVAGFDKYEHGKWDAINQVFTNDTQETLEKYEYVSRKVERWIRIHLLSWSHHREVADLKPDRQQYWLNEALRNKWSVATLRQKIKLSEFEVKPGRMWQLGNHRIMCGDCYNSEHIKKLIGDIQVDALITDPPYGIDYKPDWNKWDGSKSDYQSITGDDQEFNPVPFLNYPTVVLFGANYYSNLLPIGGWICWDKRIDEEKDAMFGSPFELAWFRSINTTKTAYMVRVLHGGVINADSIVGNNEKRFHPTQKPIQVMEKVLEYMTKLSDVVFDPFGGSGSTLLACEKAGRYCLTMEIEPDYITTVLQRWVEKTGITPEVIGEN